MPAPKVPDPATGMDPRHLSLHSHSPDDTCGRSGEENKDDPPPATSQDPDDDLDTLIAELEKEDGKEPDPETLTITPSAERPIPPSVLATDHNTGLTDQEVLTARRKYGWNRMKEQSQSQIVKFLKFFVGSVQTVMEVSSLPHRKNAHSPAAKTNHQNAQAAALLGAILKDWIDFAIISFLLVLNAAVSFIQERHAGNIVDKLKKTLAHKATVVRNGVTIEIGLEEVVPGDIVVVDDVRPHL